MNQAANAKFELNHAPMPYGPAMIGAKRAKASLTRLKAKDEQGELFTGVTRSALSDMSDTDLLDFAHLHNSQLSDAADVMTELLIAVDPNDTSSSPTSPGPSGSILARKRAPAPSTR